MLTTHTIAATVHGRFVVRSGPPQRLLLGFHGYAETAEVNIEELTKIRGTDRWTIAAIQALHPFYNTRTQQVVSSWMTRQDRELAIADNLAYVRSVIDFFRDLQTIVFFGYSQGAAMAYRSAADYGRASGLIAFGGDVPPDVVDNIPPVLVGRGSRDEIYSDEKFKKDLSFLRTITRVTACTYDGGHEWTDEFREAAAKFLDGYK